MKSAYKFLSAVLCSLFIVACGGGGNISDDGSGGTTPDQDTYALNLALQDANGSAITEVSEATPGVLFASLTLNGDPVPSARITYSIDGQGVLNPPAASALTNASGIAQISILPGTEAGSGTVTAEYVVSGDTVSNSLSFSSRGDGGTTPVTGNLLSVELVNSAGQAITQISNAVPGVVRATYTNSLNEPLANEVISFSSDLGAFNPTSGTALTNTNGVASIDLTAGTTAGASTITASVEGNEVTIGFTTLGDYIEPKPIDDYNIELTIVDSAGAVLRDITQAEPGSVVATLTQNGIAASFQTVSFSVNGEGNINPSSGSALTNTIGEAKVTLVTDTIAGAGTVTATFTLGEDQISDTFNYEVAGDAPGGDGEANKLNIALTNNVTGAPTTTVTSAEPGKVTVTLLDKDDVALEGKVVSFSSTLGSFLPAQGTALTDVLGQASIVITAGSIEGAGEITASYGSTQAIVGFVTAGDEIDPVEASPEISFDIYDCNDAPGFDKSLKNFEVCTATDNITNERPGIIGATVTRSGSTQPLQQVLVSAATTLGAISPASGTAITNDDGKAVLDLYADGDVGAGEVTLQVQEVTSTKAFEIGRVNISLDISTEVGTETLPAGGSTIVNVTVLDPDGFVETSQPFTLEFTSQCVAAGTAFIDSPVVTNAGRGFTTYRAAGCEGADTITVSAVTGGGAVNATTDVTVGAVSVGSLQYVSATPTLLALRGTGGLAGAGERDETSVVTFKLLDETAQPAPGEKVCFELSNELGGMSLSPSPRAEDFADCSNMPQVGEPEYPTDLDAPNKYAVGFTTATGEVSVIVKAGDVPTPVKVFAQWSGSTTSGHNDIISNVSAELVVTTGIADNDSFSQAASILNPEGWNFDNETVDVTVLAADHFNNLVPSGTVMAFRTEGGAIDSTCSTGTKADGVSPDGGCTVEWRSQDPRPFEGTSVTCPVIDGFGSMSPPCIGTTVAGFTDGTNSVIAEPRPGRATVTAYAIGEESFVDLNGNGLYDSGEPFGDITEAFTDHNEDGRYRDAATPGVTPAGAVNEEFVDYNTNGSFDAEDGLYTGLLCAAGSEAACTDTGSGNFRAELNVFRNLTLVMAGSSPQLKLTNISAGAISPVAPINLIIEAPQTVYLFTSDVNNNTLPYGTEISAVTDNGVLSSATTSYTVGSNSSNKPLVYAFTVGTESSPNQKTTGTLTITVKTPKGDPVSVSVTVIDAG
ncbi:beta strand repeat-containing protein [Shewanella gelidii]|uniref:Invasin n=1 Tax=Shewanella gelidii TaxID=1642821 RepID=A0A917JP05_9GAMM|nr:invasin [Shewanella gelidii]MCL1097531.1 invasin [Shewanella gelidii]GGI76007.1 invasin [Shewanella gelidii]